MAGAVGEKAFLLSADRSRGHWPGNGRECPSRVINGPVVASGAAFCGAWRSEQDRAVDNSLTYPVGGDNI